MNWTEHGAELKCLAGVPDSRSEKSGKKKERLDKDAEAEGFRD